MLQPNAIVDRHANACMDAEILNRSAAASWFHCSILGIKRIADPGNAPAGARARRYAARYRCAIKFGKQRLIAPKPISFFRVSLRTKTPLLHETRNTPTDTSRNAGNFGISRRRNPPEYRFALVVVYIDAIQCHDVKVWIEIKGIAEAMNEADGAAVSLAV
jgi:hypothetical protein